MPTYNIVRFYKDDHDSLIILTGLSLEDARAHCQDRETSSRTCKSAAGRRHTQMRGEWFDGYGEE